ncbi:MAG TPA: RNA-binding protein [Verrucomicrobiae bacterium]|nr:RNA-binding protein [Verrucomicrobiae bacterium]
MNTKLYVNNLAATTTYQDFMDLFSPYGNVVEINLPVNRANGRPRGFGFVTMATPEGARAAIQALHGKEIGTLTLIVSETRPHEAPVGLSVKDCGPRRSYSCLF